MGGWIFIFSSLELELGTRTCLAAKNAEGAKVWCVFFNRGERVDRVEGNESDFNRKFDINLLFMISYKQMRERLLSVLFGSQ